MSIKYNRLKYNMICFLNIDIPVSFKDTWMRNARAFTLSLNEGRMRFKIVNGTANLIKDIDKERSIASKSVNTANPFDDLHVEELEDGEADKNQKMDTNEGSKIDETMIEANTATLDNLNNDKQANHKEVTRQEYGELDFSEGLTYKKLK
ncbi:hypothetical protein H5410_056986, partial [Solanum commersonii]